MEPIYSVVAGNCGSEKLTGTVTRFRETLLIAMFIAYRTLNTTNAMLPETDNLFWTKNPRAKRLHPPIDPQSAWRAVTVYG